MEGQATITTVMLDTTDLETAQRFWATLLGLDVVHREEPYVYLSRICESGPYLALQRVPEGKLGESRTARNALNCTDRSRSLANRYQM